MSNTKEIAPINCHFTCQLTHLWTLSRAIFQKHTKYKLTVWKIQILILMIKMIWKRSWMAWLGCTWQCKKNWKQYRIQNKSKFLPECTVQNILMPLNTLFELCMKLKKLGGILAKPAPKKRKNYHHWNTSSGNKHLCRWQYQ